MRWLLDLAYLFAGLFYLPVVLYQALIVGKNRRGWRQRFGFVPQRPADRPRIWLHGVSLGEINATPKLVEAIERQRPGCDVVFSTTTDTGFARATHLYGADRVFRFPLDFSLCVSRAWRRVRPSMIVLVELEAWPNLIALASRRGVPVAVVNGRLTERSARRLARLGPVARSMFRKLAWVGAQEEPIAARFRALGVPPDRIEVTSSLKWDSAEVADSVDGATDLARDMGIDRSRPLWVCGSTGPGEEGMILDAYETMIADASADALQLVVVPRKPERFDEVARLIEQRGFACVRRSGRKGADETKHARTTPVLLGDTMGELRKFYSLARVVFVGRSLVPLGGSDPMEVAALGKAIIVGPYTDNFRMPIEALRRADAVRIVDSPAALSQTVAALLRNAQETEAIGRRARRVVLDNQGATERTVGRLVELLDRYAVDGVARGPAVTAGS